MKNTGTNSGSDFIPYDRALNTGLALIKGDDPHKRILGLYIVVSINLGLRIGDILKLTWEQLRQDQFTINEHKTGKKRTLIVNNHIKDALKLFGPDTKGLIFLSQKKTVYKIQTINALLKEVFYKENKTLSISSHSLRKGFGRAIYDKLDQSEKALVYLSEIFNHTSLRVTRIYLGLRYEEIKDIYMSL